VVDYPGVRDAVLTVLDLLRRHITLTAEPGLAGVPIDPRAPRELELANVDQVVSLWLHRVESQPDLLNRTPPWPAPDREPHTVTPLELCLHVTPMHRDAGTRLLLLGRTAQVLTDHRRLSGADLSGSLAGSGTVLTLGMEQLGAYELNLLWASQATFQRTGIGLRVQGVVIDSHLAPMASAPVLFATVGADQIVRSTP
jgi:Pvc16 N-terminal domain